MLCATIWRNLRWRLLAALLLVTVPAILVAWSYALQSPRSAASGARLSYLEYLDAAWFLLPGASAVFLPAAVLIAAGGTLLRPRSDVAYLLAFPVSRRRWLLMNILASLAALAALVLASALILAVGAWRAEASLAMGSLLARSLVVLSAAAPWVGVTVGVLVIVRHPLPAVILVLGIVAALPPTRFRLDLPVREAPSGLPYWDPWTLADPRAWEGGPPIVSVLTALALGVAGILLAVYRVERLEL
jgi:signal transduction histidine kinase